MAIFAEVRQAERWNTDTLMRILARHPRDGKALSGDGTAATGFFAKIELVKGYQQLTAAGVLPFERVSAAPVADEANSYVVRCGAGDGVDGAGRLSRPLHFLPGRGGDAEELSAE